MGIGFRELIIILLIALVLFGAKKLRNVGSDLSTRSATSRSRSTTATTNRRKQLKRRFQQGCRLPPKARVQRQVRQQAERLTAMFEVGFSEILLIFAIALLVLGPERLPKLAADVGRWAGRARAMARQLRTQLEQEVQYDPLKGPTGTRPARFTPAPTAAQTAAD